MTNYQLSLLMPLRVSGMFCMRPKKRGRKIRWSLEEFLLDLLSEFTLYGFTLRNGEALELGALPRFRHTDGPDSMCTQR